MRAEEFFFRSKRVEYFGNETFFHCTIRILYELTNNTVIFLLLIEK